MSGPRRDHDDWKSQHSETEVYAGPEDLMEVGSRGFLVTTLPGKEEFAVDDAIELLRQASIKLYGGIKKPKNKNIDNNCGYVTIDFMDPNIVNILPSPEGENEEEPMEEEPKTKPEGQDEVKEKEPTVTNESNLPEVVDEVKTNETSETKILSEADDDNNTVAVTSEGSAVMGTDKNKSTESQESNENDGNKNVEEEKIKNDVTEDSTTEQEDKKSDKAEIERKNKEEEERKKKEEDIPLMRSVYKFKAFCTEIRNVMFIKSNIPDPMELAEAAMEILLEHRKVKGDAVNQLLPVLGVCDYNNLQLEIMTRRVLGPIFNSVDEPKSFGILLLDKLSEPGSETLTEIVRNTIWSINPLAWLSSPLTEPDALIRLELIGSKLVLSCLRKCMRYRHFSPTLLVDFGEGEAEDDDGTWITAQQRKQQEEWRTAREKLKEVERQKEEERRVLRDKRKAEMEARKMVKSKEPEKKKHKERKPDEKTEEKTDDQPVVESSEGKAEKHSASDEEGKETCLPLKKAKLESGNEQVDTEEKAECRNEQDKPADTEVADESMTSDELSKQKEVTVVHQEDPEKKEEEEVQEEKEEVDKKAKPKGKRGGKSGRGGRQRKK